MRPISHSPLHQDAKYTASFSPVSLAKQLTKDLRQPFEVVASGTTSLKQTQKVRWFRHAQDGSLELSI